jgi:hypothetical protein
MHCVHCTVLCAALLAVALPRQHSWQVTRSACIVLVAVAMKHHQWHSVPGCGACCVCRVVYAVLCVVIVLIRLCVLYVHMAGVWEALVVGNKQPLD